MTRLGFDSLGRGLPTNSSQTTGGSTYAFSYTYNTAGQMASMTLPNSGRVVNYGYDGAGRVSSVNGTLGTTPTAYASSVSYAAHGAVASLTTPAFTETTVFNARMQPFRISAGSLLSLQYSYCPGQTDTSVSVTCAGNTGNVWGQKISGAISEAQTYSYDAVNRIAGVSAPGWSQTFGYTPWGNWYLSSASGLNALTNQTPQSSSWYSAATNRMLGWNYDEMGNLLSVPSTIGPFGYDAENRQVSGALNGETVSYVYDGDGRRVQKVSNVTGTTTYVYDARGELAQEYGGTVEAAGTQYLSVDALGSTRLVTDGSGNVQRRMDFLPFGQEILAGTGGRTAGMGYNSGSSVGSPDVTAAKFTGKERDAETGLDYFGARYFSSAQGRFTSPDWSATPQPVPYADLTDPQTLNLYSYVRNNPLRQADPDGHCPQCFVEFIESPAVQEALEKASPYVSAVGGAVLGALVSGSQTVQRGAADFLTFAVQSGGGSSAAQQDLADLHIMNSQSRPGTLGKEDHQQTVKEEGERVNGQTEVPIPTPGGAKQGRRADAVGTNPETGAPEIVQVYRPTPAGNIPKREQTAARDIQNATGVKPTMVPVRPLKPSPQPNPENQ